MSQELTPAEFYDRFGDREFVKPSLINYVSESLHHLVLQGVRGRVLDAGAGVGRFTLSLAEQCSSIVVVDISEAQLTRNRRSLQECGSLSKVECYLRRDVASLEGLDDSSFDCVVCFRGALNYSLSSVDVAIQELFRVTKPGGLLLLSVRSLFSGIRALVQNGFQMRDTTSLDQALSVQKERILRHPGSPPLRLLSIDEMGDLIARNGGEVEFMCGDGVLAAWLDGSAPQALWPKLLELEKSLACDPRCIAQANHIVLAVRKAGGV